MRRLAHIAFFGLAGALVACASDAAVAQKTVARSCFLARDLGGWREAKPNHINLRVLNGEYYQAFLYPSCPNIDFNNSITIITRTSDRVCEGDDAELIAPNGIGGRRDSCRIDRIRKLTDEEVTAIPKGEKP